MAIHSIQPQELARLRNQGTSMDLIDVRTPAEYQEMHVAFARNLPLDKLDPAALIEHRSGSSTDPIYVICRSGERGQMACEKFHKAGFLNAINVEGGTLACAEAGVPIVRGKKVMSLERQVRIAAGSLVLLGLGLSYLHPAFLGLSAFVGAGLVFAGVTNTCGMGMLLARMPWNQAYRLHYPITPVQ